MTVKRLLAAAAMVMIFALCAAGGGITLTCEELNNSVLLVPPFEGEYSHYAE